MTGSFGEGAAGLAGLAGVTLGWLPEQFWQATPSELAMVLAALMPPQEQGVRGGELARLMEQFPDG